MNFHPKKWGLFPLAILAIFPWLTWEPSVKGCTIAVVSGRATEDGRPLLWKNRDTDSRRNMVKIFTEGKYRVLAVVDAGHTESAWMGINSQGFCIINSLSLDLPRGHKTGRGNGRFMKLALETCADVSAFEALLESTNQSGRRTRANFGVMDAKGAAMLFETGHRTFTKFDANDEKTAPSGFVVRSNFSMTATREKHQNLPGEILKVYSGRRYLRAMQLVEEHYSKEDHLDFRFFLQTLSRDLAEEVDSSEGWPQSLEPLPSQINTLSTINRRSTVSAVVIHGVKVGEAPRLTTMWTLLGEPAFAVAVPCWITPLKPSELLRGTERSPLCASAGQLRALNYGSSQLLNTRWLPLIWRQTYQTENQIIQQTTTKLAQWRVHPQSAQPNVVNAFEDEAAHLAFESLEEVKHQLESRPAIAERRPVRRSTLVLAAE